MKLQNLSFLLNQVKEQHWHHLRLRRSTVLVRLEEILVLQVQPILQQGPKTGWIVRVLQSSKEVLLLIKLYNLIIYLLQSLRGIRGLM